MPEAIRGEVTPRRRTTPQPLAVAQLPTITQPTVSWIWRTPLRAAICSGLLGLLLNLVFVLLIEGLIWGMGESTITDFGLPSITNVARASWIVWALFGVLYGLVYNQFLLRVHTEYYRPILSMLSAACLGMLGFLLGHFSFILCSHWPGILWGLPGKLLWLAPTVAVFFCLIGVFLAITKRNLDLFSNIGFLVLLWLRLIVVGLLGALFLGTVFGLASWSIGGFFDLQVDDQNTIFRDWALSIFTPLGFIIGVYYFAKYQCTK